MYPFTNVSIYKCIHLQMYPFTNVSNYKYIHLQIHPFVYISTYYVYNLFQKWISGQASLAATTATLTFWSQSYKLFSPSSMLRKIG